MANISQSSRPTAIHFGAGNIGRGFIGPLLSKTHHVIFADVQEDIIDAINDKNQYDVQIVSAEKHEKETIKDVEAVKTDSSEATDAFLDAEIITTSVGPSVLSKVAPTIAKGLKARSKAKIGPINVIACENLKGATSQLEYSVKEALEGDKATMEYIKEQVGFANCVVDRIVPPFDSETVLDVAVEEYYEWVVNRKELKEPFPDVEGMKLTDNLDAYVERKLFTLNTAHAFLAYTGYLKGHDTIDQALNDPQLRAMVEAAMKESGAALVKKYGLDAAAHGEYVEKILHRFANPELDDDLLRVGRQPMRKLKKNDRLLGPVNMARDFGLPRDHLIIGIAAALLFDAPDDEEAVELQNIIKEKGLKAAVKEITGLNEGCEDFNTILKEYQELELLRKPDDEKRKLN